MDVGLLSSLTYCSAGFHLKDWISFYLDTLDVGSPIGFVNLACVRNACNHLQFASMLDETCGRASMGFE